MSNPSVRPATRDDLPAVASILVQAFGEKFHMAFGGRIDRAETIVSRTLALESEGRVLRGLFVAEENGQVVGTIALRRREDPEAPFWPATAVLFEELGLLGGLRALFYLSLLDQPCRSSEAYVSDVAVAPGARGRGIGTCMLQKAEEIARSWGKRALVLDVSARNEGAIRLYRRLGYRLERRRTAWLAGLLLGEARWLRLRKELPATVLDQRPRAL
ncbi:MAG: GNAT family N-acetyltransferase [Chloroflexia bacterium]